MKYMWLYFLQICVFLFTNVIYGIPLYKPTDKIVLLENDTITPVIYNSKFAWFVEFYSSWCGHCQQFAPVWKELGKEVEGWNNVIQIAAIDCAEARNMHTCEHFNIQGYPTLKFFKAFTNNTKDLGIVYHGDRKPPEMRRGMIDFLEAKGNPKMKLDFKPIDTKMPDVYSDKKQTWQKAIALVFERNTSYLGRELMLDLMNNPNITVKRVVNDDIRKTKYKVTRLPQVVVLLEKDKFAHLKGSQTRMEILSALREFHVEKMTQTTPKTIEVTNSHFKDLHRSDVVVKHRKENAFIIYMRDLESALTFVFQREIVIKKVLHKENLAGFVDLLVQCFPGTPHTNRFLRVLHEWLQEKLEEKDRPLRPSALRLFYNMHKADNTSLPEDVEWHTCQGSRPQFRGYPCSLWILFHTLTVNCANRGIKSLSGAEILTRIRGYVKSFFSCLECSKHFAKMSENVENEVHSHNEAILWLWRAHNKVNKRLRKEASSDPHHPKIQYPPKDFCSECTDDNNNGSWRETVVLNFLKAHYSVHNIQLTLSDEPEASDSVRYISNKGFVRVIGFGMTYFDTSLCVIVYGTGIIILVMLYIYVLKRRRRTVKNILGMA